MSSVETGQMSAVDIGQMTAAETSVLSQKKTSVLSQQRTSNIDNWNWGLSKPCMGVSLVRSWQLARIEAASTAAGRFHHEDNTHDLV